MIVSILRPVDVVLGYISDVFVIPWYVLPCLWDGAYKRTLAANRKDPLPYA